MEDLIKTELPALAEEVCLVPNYNKSKNEVVILKELYQDVLLLTSEIESRYPELYKYLDETPQASKKGFGKDVTVKELQDYVETLRKQLCNHFETHDLNSK